MVMKTDNPTNSSKLRGSCGVRIPIQASIGSWYRPRLRSAGIPLETRKALLGHANDDITTHYSAAELEELINAAEGIVDQGRTETPNLTLSVKRRKKVSEIRKGPAA